MVERVVFATNDARVYTIPPLKSNAGHRASDWDVEKPMWTGKLTVVEFEDDEKGDLKCELRLSDANNGEEFAVAPYSADGHGVEPVADSSRFFAIRVVDGPRSAILGLGFAERSPAFELNIALQDFRKHSTPSIELNNSRDYSLKEPIKVSLPDNIQKSKQQDSGPVPILPPPPSKKQHEPQSASQSTSEERDDPFDDDFGDFVG